jgi:hypothetical protein
MVYRRVWKRPCTQWKKLDKWNVKLILPGGNSDGKWDKCSAENFAEVVLPSPKSMCKAKKKLGIST